MKALLVFPNMVSGHPNRCLVVFPSLKITDQADILLLEKLNIFTVNLAEKDPFKIDLSPALKKAAEKPVEVTLTPEEEKEFALHQFKSRLPIEITGEVEKRSTNIIRVGGARVPLGNVSFALFLRLVVKLFKGGDGCVPKGDPVYGGGLIDEGYLKAAGVDQAIQRLREKLAPALNDLPSNKFIEVYRAKHLRLSTHPAYVYYDKEKLLHHEEENIRKCANQLP